MRHFLILVLAALALAAPATAATPPGGADVICCGDGGGPPSTSCDPTWSQTYTDRYGQVWYCARDYPGSSGGHWVYLYGG